MSFVAKLGGWLPDADQPVIKGDTADKKFDDHVAQVQSVGSGVSSPGVETNGVLDLRSWCSPIENQSKSSSCAANATVGALEFLQIRNGQPLVDLSRLFTYYNARLMVQEQDRDEGSYIRLNFATLTTLGTCPESTWQFNLSQMFVRPSWQSYREGYANKIASFYRISPATWSELNASVKQALRAQHPVVFGMTVDQDYINTGSDGRVAMPKASRVNSGGHAQVIVGYDDNTQCWIVRNSWGVTWGDKGYGYVPYAYLEASDANDFWVPYLPASSTDTTTVTVTPP